MEIPSHRRLWIGSWSGLLGSRPRPRVDGTGRRRLSCPIMRALLLILCLSAALSPACAQFTVGVNYPWHQENGQHLYGALFGEMTDARRAAVESHFADMQEAGVRRLRIWLLASGWRWPERVAGQIQ